MKALLLSDEINQFHWSVLKSVFLILSLLPISQFFLSLLSQAEGGAQIVVGFMALSVFSAVSILAFYSALNAIEQKISTAASKREEKIVRVYQYMPMLSLATMLSYLASQL